jgi:two-component system, NtrC family, response regulator GlrR
MPNILSPVTESLGFGIRPRLPPGCGRKGAQLRPAVRRARILLIDNDPEFRHYMNRRLASAYYRLESAESARAALQSCARERPDLVIMDLRLDDMDGLTLLKEIKSRWPILTVVIVTAHATIAEAVQATQYGAFGFLLKPVDKAELLNHVTRALAASNFTQAAGDLRAQIVTRSRLMEERLGLAKQAAGSEEPVLLTGENGTGKELLARAIHAASSRRDQPFVAVRCRDVDEDTLELELFGRRASPARRARSGQAGALQAAAGGTLLLDEVDYLPVRLQVALAATLFKPATPANFRRPARPEVRLIGTASRDLKALMLAGAFRHDFYYQINVLPIEIPPLGRRREDIPLLISHFLQRASGDDGYKKIYSRDAIELLAMTDWPGNVRQLFELVKQNVALSQGKVITKELVERSLGAGAKKVPTYDEARDGFSRDYLALTLHLTTGNISQSARLAKRSRTDFYDLLARYQIQPNDFKRAAPGAVKRKFGPHRLERKHDAIAPGAQPYTGGSDCRAGEPASA